jgi:hypothetical protein
MMLTRFFMLLIGFGFAVAGGVTLIAFMNLIAAGHGFLEYFLFVGRRPEFYLFLVGMGIIWGSVYFPSGRK